MSMCHSHPPRIVADAFVKQYYKILEKSPENIHKFYTESSLLGWQENDGVITHVTTLSAINAKIMSSDYKNCLAEVESVDAQASHDGGVFIVVTGSFTDKDEVVYLFFQSFFLARQEKGFFVRNDILRVFDAVDDASSDGRISESATSDEVGKLDDESSYILVPKDTSSSPASSVASVEKTPRVVEPNADVTPVVARLKTYLWWLYPREM